MKCKVEVYPMKQHPNKWQWRFMAGGRAICKGCGTYVSEAGALKGFKATVSKLKEGDQ